MRWKHAATPTRGPPLSLAPTGPLETHLCTGASYHMSSRAVYLRALAEAEQVPELNSDALTAAPGVGQSTAQVVHNVDDLAAKR